MHFHWHCECIAQSSILSISSLSPVLLWDIFQTILDNSSFPLFHSGQVFHILVCQSHYTVLLSSFLLPFSCIFKCCCSLPCISQILQAQIFSFSVLIAEEQAGFRAGRSTTEQIFNLRILCKKYLQHQRDLYHVFIDFKKAFDRVWHAALLATMKK